MVARGGVRVRKSGREMYMIERTARARRIVKNIMAKLYRHFNREKPTELTTHWKLVCKGQRDIQEPISYIDGPGRSAADRPLSPWPHQTHAAL